MSINTSYKKIPKELESRVYIISGTYPGVGKSYIKNKWCDSLRNEGYRVYNCGTTQKASEESTVASNSRLKSTNNWQPQEIHKRTNGFYFIDEAFMWTQERTNELLRAYPHCCFFLFGDPLQFDPVENGQPIFIYDYAFSLTKQFRAKDDILMNAIKSLKEGKLPIDFLYEHAVDHINGDELRVCYRNTTKDKYNSVTNEKHVGYIYRSSQHTNGATIYSNVYHFRDLQWKNGQLWKIIRINDIGDYDLVSLDGKHYITVSDEILDTYFQLHMAINNHKIQGDTISECNLWVDFENLDSDLLFKHLYVAISRANRHTQIKFLKSQINNIISSIGACLNSSWYKTGLDIASFEQTDSVKLSQYKITDLLDYLIKSSPKVPRYCAYIHNNNDKNTTNTSSESIHNVDNTSNSSFNIAQQPDYIELIEKDRRKTIQKFLKTHYGEGFSKKWSDIEKQYADSIREKYTLEKQFMNKCNKIDRK